MVGFAEYTRTYETRLGRMPFYRKGARGPDQLSTFAARKGAEYAANASRIRDMRFAQANEFNIDRALRSQRERIISNSMDTVADKRQLEGLRGRTSMKLSRTGGALSRYATSGVVKGDVPLSLTVAGLANADAKRASADAKRAGEAAQRATQGARRAAQFADDQRPLIDLDDDLMEFRDGEAPEISWDGSEELISISEDYSSGEDEEAVSTMQSRANMSHFMPDSDGEEEQEKEDRDAEVLTEARSVETASRNNMPTAFTTPVPRADDVDEARTGRIVPNATVDRFYTPTLPRFNNISPISPGSKLLESVKPRSSELQGIYESTADKYNSAAKTARVSAERQRRERETKGTPKAKRGLGFGASADDSGEIELNY